MRNRALKYTLGIAAIGILITLLIVYVERNTLKTYEQNIPYISLGDHIKNRTTKAHLWFEELMAGDPSLNFDRDVIGLFRSSHAILKGAYDGKETEIGAFEETNDEETKALLKEAIFDVEKLTEAAQERWKAKNEKASAPAVTDSTGAIIASQENVGGEMDQRFDVSFEEFQATMDRLMEHVGKNVQADSSYLNILSWISVVLVLLTFAALCIMLYRLQAGNDKMVAENTNRMTQQDKAVQSLSGFIEAISAGDYTIDLQMEGDDAGLTNSLIKMRNKLRDNAEDDRKRNWGTSGLAQVGEILRTNTRTTEELYDNIIKFVVKYTKSNQGGLFLLNEDNEADKYLELVACYAFERKKYLHRRVDVGEGLVGQCYLEGERIYMLEVPQEYISITSGLGGANPNALLIVPLKVNERIFGVLELATFGKYAEFEIELVEKLAESIASTISTVRVNESTRILLEKTQQQAEEMRAQEEEMRQNMEELEATQEEMRRKEKHIQNMLDEEKQRNDFSQRGRQLVMELTKNKNVQAGNWGPALENITAAIARQLGISRCSIWLDHVKENKMECVKLYRAGKGVYESGMELSGNEYPVYVAASRREDVIMAKDVLSHSALLELADPYMKPEGITSLLNVPFFNEGKVAGVISCEQQREQKDWSDDHVEFLKSCADLVTVTYNTMRINAMLDNLNDAQETMQTIIDNIPRAVFWKDKDLRFQGCNRIFAQVAGLTSPKDLIGHTDFDMPWKDHAEAYRADDLAVMNSRKARLDLEERNVNSSGQESWVLTSKVPVMNHHGEVVAVLGMFEDITDRKLKEADMAAKLRELEELRKLLENRKN